MEPAGHSQLEDDDSHVVPKITATISIDHSEHSFSSSQAPTLHLHLTSYHSDPITIYADETTPSMMLRHVFFATTDLATGIEVPNTIRTHCKLEPPSKIIVPLREDLFHTLYPDTPLTLSCPFTRTRSQNGGTPLPRSHPDYEKANSPGTERRKELPAYGVDGLEPGHSYALTMADNPRANFCRWIRWWEIGIRENVVYGNDGVPKLDGRKVRFRRAPHPSIRVDISEFKGLMFHCTD